MPSVLILFLAPSFVARGYREQAPFLKLVFFSLGMLCVLGAPALAIFVMARKQLGDASLPLAASLSLFLTKTTFDVQDVPLPRAIAIPATLNAIPWLFPLAFMNGNITCILGDSFASLGLTRPAKLAFRYALASGWQKRYATARLAQLNAAPKQTHPIGSVSSD